MKSCEEKFYIHVLFIIFPIYYLSLSISTNRWIDIAIFCNRFLILHSNLDEINFIFNINKCVHSYVRATNYMLLEIFDQE